MSRAALAPWVICTVCSGDGKVDNLGPVDRSGFDEDEWRMYLDGGHQVTCPMCVGRGSIREDVGPLLERSGTDGQRVFYVDAAEASEHFLRMAEGWA